MLDFNKFIGLEKNIAINRLQELGYQNINIILNSKHNDKCDTEIVCKISENANEITLVCGEFYVDMKEN